MVRSFPHSACWVCQLSNTRRERARPNSAKSNYVLQRTPGTSYVSINQRHPAPLNTALVGCCIRMNSGEVYFSLRSPSLIPEAVTAAIGVNPTRVGLKADPTPKTSFWDLSSGKVVAEVVDVYELGEAVLRPLLLRAEAIRSVAKAHDASVTLQVVLTISMDERLSTPAVGFSESIVAFLASVGASIDVDTYRAAG
jgi:hypothetical protein